MRRSIRTLAIHHEILHPLVQIHITQAVEQPAPPGPQVVGRSRNREQVPDNDVRAVVVGIRAAPLDDQGQATCLASMPPGLVALVVILQENPPAQVLAVI
jgi:hypothetical protein